MHDAWLVIIGVVLVVTGVALPRARPGAFGVRTPWTLASDRVWIRTHRLAGRLTLAAGLLTLIARFSLPPDVAIGAAFAGAIAAPVGSVVYSYLAWKREQSA